MAGGELHWYVIRSKYRNETLLWQQLCRRHITAYYPRICAQTENLRTQKVKPYFPGYMFIHIDMGVVGTSALQWMPGAAGLLCFGGEPAFISDGILYGIQQRVDRMNSMGGDPPQRMKHGDEVEIYSGPFAGYRGIFDRLCSDEMRTVVFLRFICDQQMRVELQVNQIGPTNQCPTRL